MGVATGCGLKEIYRFPHQRGGSRGGFVGLQPPQNIRIVLPARARMRVCTYVRRYRSGRRHTHAELLIEWRMA